MQSDFFLPGRSYHSVRLSWLIQICIIKSKVGLERVPLLGTFGLLSRWRHCCNLCRLWAGIAVWILKMQNEHKFTKDIAGTDFVLYRILSIILLIYDVHLIAVRILYRNSAIIIYVCFGSKTAVLSHECNRKRSWFYHRFEIV